MARQAMAEIVTIAGTYNKTVADGAVKALLSLRRWERTGLVTSRHVRMRGEPSE